jgi:hypothetical protein
MGGGELGAKDDNRIIGVNSERDAQLFQHALLGVEVLALCDFLQFRVGEGEALGHG